MLIPTSVITEFLSSAFTIKTSLPKRKDIAVAAPKLVSEAGEIQPSCINIIRVGTTIPPQLMRDVQDTLFIVFEEKIHSVGIPCILVLNERTESRILNALNDLYARKSSWIHSLDLLVSTEWEMQRFIDLSADAVGLPLRYADFEVREALVAIPSDMEKSLRESFFYARAHERELFIDFQDFNQIPKYLGEKQDPTPHEISIAGNAEPLRIMSVPVGREGTIAGYLTADLVGHEKPSTVRWCLQLMRDVVEEHLDRLVDSATEAHRNVHDLARSVLEGQRVERSSASNVLDSAGFAPDSSYVCVMLKVDLFENEQFPFQFVGNQFELHCNRALSVCDRSAAKAIVEAHEGLDDLMATFGKLEKAFYGRAYSIGVSGVFDNFFSARQYIVQAEKACEFGRTAQPDRCVHFFDDIASSYILSIKAEELYPETLCARGLLKLRELDRKSTVAYCETLALYLKNAMNVSKTARELYVQRSTLLFRLEKINDTIEMDLDDPNERLYMEMSLKILGYW